MRLLLLPISTRRALIYCEPPALSGPKDKQSYLDKAATYAATTWTGWEKSETKWKLKTTQYGNQLLRRVPFEEWGLKSIPSLSKAKREMLEASLAKSDRIDKIEVRYPGLYQGLSKEGVLPLCANMGVMRQALHRKRAWYSFLAMPLTIPFGLLPIIPNLPFFYLAFRCYSHWRALTGSQHLDFLAKNNLLHPRPSATLDSLYSAGLLHATRADSRGAQDPTPEQSKQIVNLISKQMKGEGLTPGNTNSTGKPHAATEEFSTNKEGRIEVNAPPIHAAPIDSASKTEPSGEHQQAEKESGTHYTGDEEIMLLKGWNGKLIAERLGLPGLEVEIERAVEQVERDLQKGEELLEEKREIESAVGRPADAKDVGKS